MNHWDNWHSEPRPPPLPLSCRNNLCEHGCVTSHLTQYACIPYTGKRMFLVSASTAPTVWPLTASPACWPVATSAPEFMLQEPHSACGLSEISHRFMPPHLGSSPCPLSLQHFFGFFHLKYPNTFQYGQMSTHSLEALSDALDFQMFMTNGLTLHLYGLHTFQFLCLYLMIMPFIVFFSAKRRKKFFLREATFFHLWIPNL